jgi:hypothetical protein
MGGGEGTQIFSLIQAQNVQVKLLAIFNSGKSLIFVVFFFNLMPDPLRIDFFACPLTPVCVLKVTLVTYLIFH